jgi:alanine dehydrogenase
MVAFGMMAVAQEAAMTLRITPQIEINQDSIGFALTPDGVGIVSNTGKVVIVKTETGELIVIGNTEDEIKGIRVTGDGKIVFINADTIVILRKTFASHSEADAELQVGEEYYLLGDRGVYRKP